MMDKRVAFLLAVFILASTTKLRLVSSANVLCMFTNSARSQLSVFMAVANTLVDRDHNVTIVTTTPIPPQMQSKKHFRHIQLDPPSEDSIKLSAPSTEFVAILKYILVANMFPTKQRDVLTQVKFKEFLQEDNHFDLMLLGYFNNDFIVGVAGRYRCPIAVISLGLPFGPVNRMVGNPDVSSFVPFPLFGRNQPMSFTERMSNFVWAVLEPIVHIYVNWIMEDYYKGLFPDEFFPKYSDLITNVSLVLCNSHFSEKPIQPLVPAVVEIGGIQVKEQPDPLPEQIENFLDTSDKGAILFNVGSKMRGTYLTSEQRAIVFNVLSRLDQKVLWEWEEDEAPPKIANILFQRSLPIDDILFHRNLRLFMTDGRHNVVYISAIHGIPMLGIPLYAEEPYYIEGMVDLGYGVAQDPSTLSEESLQGALTKVLQNPNFSRTIKHFSSLFHDRPTTPRQSAAFWLEYVIRHRGALHMQSPLVHMDFIQQWNIDLMLTLWALFYSLRKLVNFVVFVVRFCLLYRAQMGVKFKLQ